MATAHGGVMLRVDEQLSFIPASIAIKVMPTPEIGAVPGAPPELRGVALVDGDMIPVVEVASESGGDRGAMLVCAILGERVGLVGIEIVATGRFEVDPSSGDLRLGDETARVFDVGALIAKVREGRWAV